MSSSFDSEQFDQLCRICAKRSYKMKNLFDDINADESLSERIYRCTQIHLTQQLDRPSKMCYRCVNSLEQAYEFYQSVKNSEDTFQKMLFMSTENSYCPNDTAVPAEIVEVKMELPDEEQIEQIEHYSATLHAGTVLDVDIKEEQIENSSPEMDSIVEEMPKQSIKKRKRAISTDKPRAVARSNRTFECYRCKATFPSCWKTSVHLKKHYAEEKFKCTVCGSRFIVSNDYNRHLCQGSSIACAYCNEIFDATIALINHLEQTHDEKTLFKCEKCAQFYSMELLKQIHMVQHVDAASDDNKPFSCNICKKRFASRLSLRNHKEIHTDEKCTFAYIDISQISV